MAKQRLSINVDADLYNAILESSKNEHISASAFVNKILKENIKTTTTLPDKEERDIVENNSKSRIWLDAETTAILHKKAKELGFTDTAFVRRLIHTKNFKIYYVQTEDINLLINEVHKAISSLSSSISLIKKYGKGEVYEADVKKILNDSDEIKVILRKIVANLYGTRRTAQQKLVKKYSG